MPEAKTTQVGGDHYETMAIQPERYIYVNGIGFHEGSAIKYLSRWRKKGGVKDLEKAKHFIDMLIAYQDNPETPFGHPDEPTTPKLDWHNPAGLQSPGVGWRFCIKGEMEDPPHTQWWSPGRRMWLDSGQLQNTELTPVYTYRTRQPLP